MLGEQRAAPALLVILLALVAAHRPAFRQERPYQRCVALVLASLLAFARHTLAQLVLALGLGETDWSAWYRLFSVPRLDYAVLTGQFLRATLAQVPAEAPYVVVVDGVQRPRTSQRMPGTSWLKAPRTPPWKPGMHRAQRFVPLAARRPRSAGGYSRALPLRWAPASPPKAVPGRTPPRREGEAARGELAWLRRELDAAGRAAQRLLAVADGSYDVAALGATLPPRTVLLARGAKNRARSFLPAPPPAPRRGARRQ